MDPKIHTLTVTHEDRLLRFGVGLVKFVCEKVGTTFRVVETKPPESFESELARDVITLMTVFCARLCARRARKKSVKCLDRKHFNGSLIARVIAGQSEGDALFSKWC